MTKIAKILLCIFTTVCLILTCGCSSGSTDTSSIDSTDDSASTASDTASGTASKPKLTDEQMKATNYIPTTWFKQEDNVKSLSAGKFVFGAQTDTHHHNLETPNLARNMAGFSHFVDFDFICNLGDLVRGYSIIDIDSPTNMRACMDDLVQRYTTAKCPVLMTLGNHDANHMWTNKHMPGDHTTLISEVEHFERVILPLKEHNGDDMVTNGASTYYYMDFPEDNIRVVMLNTTDGKFTESMSSTSMISDEQLNWFKNTALNTDKYVIVMSHIPFYSDKPEEAGTVRNGNNVLLAVEEFIDDGGNFVGYFHGHMHERCINVDDNGRFHMGFLNGTEAGEAVVVDIENKVVTSIILGNGERREVRFS